MCPQLGRWVSPFGWWCGPHGPAAPSSRQFNEQEVRPVYKRALLLTAATMALLSAPAFAADNNSDITTKVTTNLKTSTANAGAASNILIESNGFDQTSPAVRGRGRDSRHGHRFRKSQP